MPPYSSAINDFADTTTMNSTDMAELKLQNIKQSDINNFLDTTVIKPTDMTGLKLRNKTSAIISIVSYFLIWSKAEQDRIVTAAEKPSSMAAGTAPRERQIPAVVNKEDVPEEVLSVNVEISTTGEHVGLFVVTCCIEDAATCTGAEPETTNLPSGSTRRYSFRYPHEPGRPRMIGLSGDMLDLASQTPLGSEHSWKIRTKGSRRNFRYEIEVDCAAGHAELIVDDEKKYLDLPWVSVEERDCESTSRKAEGHTEKKQ